MFKGKTSLLGISACLILAATTARGSEELCQIQDWPCAALSATVGSKTVRAIHDPMHRDERILDGGIADITVRGGQVLTLAWRAQPDSANKAKAKVKFSVITNKPPAPDCPEPSWHDESFSGSKDIAILTCHIGRNFVVTFKMEQGKGKAADLKTARIRIHVLAPQARVDESADHDATSSEPVAPKLAPDQEADFKQLGEE